MLVGSTASSEDRRPDSKTAQPIATMTIPSLKNTFDDLKFVFDLARDEKGYQTFKETLDEFLVGVDTDHPCSVNVFLVDGGLANVLTAPVKDEAAFQKFLKNLWDLDVKTAPPPSAQLQRQVPRSVQEKLRTAKLQPNEKLLFGLTEGAMLFDHGYVHLGPSLEAVRMARGTSTKSAEKDGSLAIHMHSDVEPASRHAAFEKSKHDILSRPTRDTFGSDADFELALAVVDYQLAKLERLVADSSKVHAVYTVARDKKTSQFEADVTPASGTPLAKEIAGLGHQPDLFAGVARQNAVVTATANLPVDAALGKLLKVVAEKAHASAVAHLDSTKQLDANQVQIDKDLANLIFAVTTDVAGIEVFNGCLRTWTDTEGKLTTLGATRVSQVDKIRELLQKFQHRERVSHSIAGAEILKVSNEHWKKDAPEVFGSDGSLYLGTSGQAFWFAMGPQAMERLEQAIQASGHERGAATGGTSSSATALEIQADMRSLTQVWDAIGSRRSPQHEAKPVAATKEKANSKAKPKAAASSEKTSDAKAEKKRAVTASAVADLQLHKLAGESFKEQDGHFDLTLTQAGDKAHLVIKSDEGILRFVGHVLSAFTKQNLADN